MISVLFTPDKTLVQTKREAVYLGEKNLTKIRFYIPGLIEGEETSEYNVIFKYILPDGTSYTHNLEAGEEYKGYNTYDYPLTSNFTSQAGDVDFSVSLIKIIPNGEELTGAVYSSGYDRIEIEGFEHENRSPDTEEEHANIYWDAEVALFPIPGKTDAIYIATNSSKIYRWDAETEKYLSLGADITNLPIATRDTLGLIKIGDGLIIDKNGAAAIDFAADEEVREMLGETLQKGD